LTSGGLSSFKILEFGDGNAGAFACRLMAGYGAEVWKVEPPNGDAARRLGPFPGDVPNVEVSAPFLFLAAGKKSVTLDTSNEAGRRRLHEFAAGFDALVLSGTAPDLDTLGLDSLAETAVVTYVTPFGREGPYREWRATELIWEAMGGLMHITGQHDREPLKNPGVQVSYIAGYHIYGATLAALYARLTSGTGQIADISMMECAVHVLENTFMRWQYQAEIRRRGGTFRSPVYPAGDGFVAVVMGLGEERWRSFAEMIEAPELLEPRFMGRAARADMWDEIDQYLIPWLMDHEKEWIVREAQRRGLLFGAARTSTDLLANRQLDSRGFYQAVDHPVAGALNYPGAPYDASEVPWNAGRAPLLGEHNGALEPETP
jgi:crotonobetainyl-CoA:carnitine CoA-transferase CaiB-like acyl-CoA transferase